MNKALVVTLLICIVIAVMLFQSGRDMTMAKDTYQDEFIRMDIASEQASAHTMKESSFTLTITNMTGEPFSGANLEVVLSMPGMFCGSFPAKVTEAKPGSYVAVGIPVMRGEWQAEARLQTDDKTRRVIYPFIVD
ncbi:FixH family protein [Paenibacillus periandrae]|uniref:FixH family protein n=1 Tax=Paenibacillus periandrae TaxID=1761741 RepID=UPI001F09B088|nr:FixH family protein [Paenibacillus periandrae]